MKANFWLFLILANILFVVVSIPMFLTWLKTPADTFYTGVHGTPIDYFQYLSVIREGMNGSWQTSDLYTTEETPKSIVFVYFLIIGKIGGLFSLSPILIYHIARVGAVEFMFISMYLLCRQLLGNSRAFWAATLGLFLTVPPVAYFGKLQTDLGDIKWWDVLDSLHRVDYLPHHAFGIALLFSCVLFILRFFQDRKLYQFLIALFSSFACGLIYPTPALLLIVTGLLSGLLYLFLRYFQDKIFDLKRTFPIFLICFGALLSLLIMRAEIEKGFPWSGWKNGYEVWLRIPNFERNFILAYSFPLLLGFPAIIISFFNSKEFSKIFLATWALTPIVLILLSSKLGLERIRMAYMGQFVAFGILMSMTLQKIARKKRSNWTKYIFFGIIFLLTLNSLLSPLYYLRGRLSHEVYDGGIFHLQKSLTPAYKFIDTNVPLYSNVLGDFIIGITLPGFATVKTYFGHWTQTIDYWRKADESGKILSGQVAGGEAAAILSRGKIDYIVARSAEQINALVALSLKIPLKTVYSEDDVRIFEVEKNSLSSFTQ